MVRAKLGQHMLIDKNIIDYEVAMARCEGKTVLEIGGGTGNLTEALAAVAKKVITIEKDPSLARGLREKFNKAKNVKIIEGDFLELKQKDIGKIDIIVGNIPYYISSPILFKLIEWKFDRAILCFQKEFAQRMVAKPGTREYGRLSVMTQLYFKPVLLRTVKAGAFRPIPKVNSAIVLLTKTGEKIDRKRDELIRMLFVHKNKTLRAVLKTKEFRALKMLKNCLEKKAGKLNLSDKRVFQLEPKVILNLAKPLSLHIN